MKKLLFLVSAAVAAVGSLFAANRIIELSSEERVAIFDEPGFVTYEVPVSVTGKVEILIVGGGGGGGGITGGGGGGGQVLHYTDVPIVPGEVWSITVADGGVAGGYSGANGGESRLQNGDKTQSFIAVGGGGGGGGWGNFDGLDGANGGGAGGNSDKGATGGASTVAGGFPGADRETGYWGPGGGGGAGEAGHLASDGDKKAFGGTGVVYAVTGIAKMYGYGGGGSINASASGKGGASDGWGNADLGADAPATPGEEGTGGGGGGGQWGKSDRRGGDGGSGTVILRYAVDLDVLSVDVEVENPRGFLPYEVRFTATPHAGSIEGVSYVWNFGDGTGEIPSSESSVAHTYKDRGVYTVSVKAIKGPKEATKVLHDAVHIAHKDIYVDALSLQPVVPYATPETAAANVIDALDALELPGQRIFIAPGFYPRTDTIQVTNDVSIIGTGARPEDVVITNANKSTPWDARYMMMKVNHANARISNLTIAKGAVNAQVGNFGANLTLLSGVVSNCVMIGGMLRSCTGDMSGPAAMGALVKGKSAFLTHCRFTGGENGMNNQWGSAPNASGVAIVGGGRVSNCLFHDINADCSDVVTVIEGSIDNSTIVNCKVGEWAYGGSTPVKGETYGLRLTNTLSYATNVVVANVRRISDTTVNRACAVNVSRVDTAAIACATETDAPINDTCFKMTTADFADYAGGDFSPKCGGALYNRGVNIMLPAVDLAGNPRLVGRKVDIGCYESQRVAGLMMIVK